MTELTIKQFVNGECPYHGCIYNSNGFCENDSDQLLIDVMIEILDQKEINDKYFRCSHSSIKPNTCEFCGQYLESTLESRGEYFGIPVREEVWYCPNCD